jgi:hypothetical protein
MRLKETYNKARAAKRLSDAFSIQNYVILKDAL